MHAPSFKNEPIEYNKSFSRGIKIRYGKVIFLFISGTASVNKDGKSCHAKNFPAQTKRVFDNLTGLLQSEKANWRDVVQTRCYLKNMRYYEKFNRYRNWFYEKLKLNPFPASVCVQANLCRPELLVEIEAVAIVTKKQ